MSGTMLTCAFCRSNRNPWVGHTAELCSVLANVECGYCHQKGHTPKRCPKSALKKKRDEEIQKRREEMFPTLVQGTNHCSENKKTNWASLVANSLSPEEREKIDQQHYEQLQKTENERKQLAEQKKKDWEERKRRWEERNQRRIIRQYGVDQEGSFWFFFTERTNDDIPLAKTLREDITQQHKFKKYLNEKYWRNWLSRSEFTEDDCPILDRWRWEAEKEEYEREERENREVEEYVKQQDELYASMNAKVASGELTQQEYNDWKWHKELEEDYAWQAEGEMVWRQMEKEQKDYDNWKQRQNK